MNHNGALVDHFELMNLLVSNYDTMQPTMIWGGPGLGKSDSVRQAGKVLAKIHGSEFEIIDLRLLLLESSDLRGMPYVDSDDNCQWAIAPFLPKNKEGKGIIFLDELPAASQQLMKAAYQLVWDRAVGEYTLPDGYLVVGAGNRISDRGGVNQMPTPLKNRFMHVEIDEGRIWTSWKDWAYKAGINDNVLGYLGFRQGSLYKFDTTYNAFPSPRSWEMVSHACNTIADFNPVVPDILDMAPEKMREIIFRRKIEGLIGPGIAGEFHAFLKIREKLPSREDILSGRPYTFDKDDVSIIYAISTMLTSYFAALAAAKKKPSNKEIECSLSFIERIDKKEMQVICIKDICAYGKVSTIINGPAGTAEMKQKLAGIFSSLKTFM